MKKIIKIITFFIFNKKIRREIRKKLLCKYSMIDYGNLLAEKAKKDQLTVLFIVSQNQKWSSDSLYIAMKKDDYFLPKIVITKQSSYGTNSQKDIYDKNVKFFKDKGFDVVDGYDFDHDKIIELSAYNPDIVFYQQPLSQSSKYNVEKISKYALTCYIPYSVLLSENADHYNNPFQHSLWKIFLDSELNYNRFQTNMLNHAGNCIVSGYPKLDYFLNKTIPNIEKKTIIYAPHHSFEATGLRFATFDWNGEFILNLAKQNPDINFVLKPHPRFKHGVIKNKVMTEEQITKYLTEWEELPNCSTFDNGDYFDLLIKSTAMITDCSSFLGEYSFTGHPLIHLISKNSVGYNQLGREISDKYYKIRSVQELGDIFQRVIVENDDFRKEERQYINRLLTKREEGAGSYIANYLKEKIGG